MKIGAVTIGQSPRVDIVPELKEAIGFDVEIEERGALDGLSLDEVRGFAPEAGDYVLVRRVSRYGDQDAAHHAGSAPGACGPRAPEDGHPGGSGAFGGADGDDARQVEETRPAARR